MECTESVVCEQRCQLERICWPRRVRRFPAQYSHIPISTSAPQPPTILKTARALFGSSGGGRTDMAIVKVVVTNPTIDNAYATGFPPGTRMTSAAAGSRCNLNIDANKYK